LKRLGEKRVVRVAATGRSLFKVNDVLPENTPIDYVVFSSGAGIYDWNKKQLLHSEHFQLPVFNELCRHLLDGDYNFLVFRSIPHNNLFSYHQGAGRCAEFEDYLGRHQGDYTSFDPANFPVDAGQVMAIIPNDGELFDRLKKEIYAACGGLRVIRTTSPIDDRFIWLEVFPDTVSKGHGLEWLCNSLEINRQNTIGIGNDYNDWDMFRFVEHPYLLQNGVKVLCDQFQVVPNSNEESGVTAVLSLFDL
jgi:hydroxymethylpyrimidine pyrophosphatase-like HAD family hydrolase